MPGVPSRATRRGWEARRGEGAELVSVAVSPWTRLSRKPEKRVCLSAAREDLGVSLSFSLFLGVAGETLPTRNARATFAFTEARGRIQRSTGALETCGLLGGLQLGLELGDAGRHRSLWSSRFPLLWVIHPRRGRGRGSSAVSPQSWRVLFWLFGTGSGACALVDFSSRVLFE